MVRKELIGDQFKFHLSKISVKNRGRSSLVGELNCFKGESAIPVCNQLDQIVANGPICINRPDWIALMGPGRDINNTSSRLTVHFPTQCKQRTPSSPNLEPLGHKRPSPLQSVVSVVQALLTAWEYWCTQKSSHFKFQALPPSRLFGRIGSTHGNA